MFSDYQSITDEYPTRDYYVFDDNGSYTYQWWWNWYGPDPRDESGDDCTHYVWFNGFEYLCYDASNSDVDDWPIQCNGPVLPPMHGPEPPPEHTCRVPLSDFDESDICF